MVRDEPQESDGAPPDGLRCSAHVFRFPKSARLTRSGEFSKMKHAGVSFHGKFVVLSVLKRSPPEPTRVGFITSRRVGAAVQRNKVRRRLRELVRTSQPLRPGFWLVLIARAAATRATWEQLREEFTTLAGRATL